MKKDFLSLRLIQFQVCPETLWILTWTNQVLLGLIFWRTKGSGQHHIWTFSQEITGLIWCIMFKWVSFTFGPQPFHRFGHSGFPVSIEASWRNLSYIHDQPPLIFWLLHLKSSKLLQSLLRWASKQSPVNIQWVFQWIESMLKRSLQTLKWL